MYNIVSNLKIASSIRFFTEEGRDKSVDYLQGYIDSYDEYRSKIWKLLLRGATDDTKIIGYSQALEEKLKEEVK